MLRDSTSAAFTVFRGGQPNDGVNWTAPQPIGPASADRLAGGPSGLFVMLGAGGRLEVRRLNGASFGAAAAIPSSESNSPSGSDLTQDAGGRLTATWDDGAGNLFQSTSGDGLAWTTQKRATLMGHSAERVAAAADHQGVIVYKTGSGASAIISAVPIAAVSMAQPVQPPLAGRIGAVFTYLPATPCTDVQERTLLDYGGWIRRKKPFEPIAACREQRATAPTKTAGKSTVLGAKQFTIPPGKRSSVKVKLGKQPRALIGRRHLKRLSVVVLSMNGRGARLTRTATLGSGRLSHINQSRRP